MLLYILEIIIILSIFGTFCYLMEKFIIESDETNHKGCCYHCEEQKTDINYDYCCKECEDAEIRFNELDN
jgi:hypothetical protein